MRRNPVAHKLEAVANVSDQKAHSALVWMAEKARQVNPRSTPIQYHFQGKIPLHMLKSITEVKGRGKGYTVRRSGKKVTVTSTGTPDSYCWIIEAEAPTRDKKVPIVFVIHEYPKRRKNPKFKVGDRVIEGRRKGKVTALHSPGTVDVLFDDMSYAIRRQAPNVRKR